MAMDRCGLCGADVSPRDKREAAGVALCEPCFDGDYGDRLDDLGLRIQDLAAFSYSPSEQPSGDADKVEVRGAIPAALELRASFTPERVLDKVGKLFKKELQAGDPAFDKAVFIRTEHLELLGEALQSARLRAAIQGAVEDLSQPIVIVDNTITFNAEQLDAAGCAGLRRHAALILHELAAFASKRGLSRQPELAHFPDLSLVAGSGVRQIVFRHSTLDDLLPLAALAPSPGASEPLERLQLESVHLRSGDLGPLSSLTELKSLTLIDVPAVVDVAPLAALEQLESLTIIRAPVADVSGLAALTNLRELVLQGTAVIDVTPLAALTNLRELVLLHTPVVDVSALGGLEQLAMLDLRRTSVSDVAALASLRNLKDLRVRHSKVTTSQLQDLRQHLPGVVPDLL